MYGHMLIIGKYTYILIHTCIHETLFPALSHTHPTTQTHVCGHANTNKTQSTHRPIPTYRHANR